MKHEILIDLLATPRPGTENSAHEAAESQSPRLEEMGVDRAVVEKVHHWASEAATYGRPASYIPELSQVDPSKRALAIGDLHRNIVTAGNGVDVTPTIQSVVKPFLYLYALERGVAPEQISRVEATSLSFQSDRVLDPSAGERHPGHPLNNAGGISSAGAIEPFEKFLDFMRTISGNPDLAVQENIFASEMRTNNNNRAISYRLAASGRFNSQAEAERALESYTLACAIGMGVRETLEAGLFLAGGGRLEGESFVHQDHVVRTLNAMNSFGLYQYTGSLTLLAAGARALTCKSGVSGLMLNVDPGRGAFCTYCPLLDYAGNSVYGKYALIPLNHLLSAPRAMRLSTEQILSSIEGPMAREGGGR